MPDLATHDWAEDPLVDSAIVQHGFTTYMRDYDVIVEVPAAKPDRSGSYVEGRYCYRFTHCVEAHVETAVRPDVWQCSWTDEFISYASWEQAGSPSGYVWGVAYADAYPGPSRVVDSRRADLWTHRLGKQMHEVQIETNVILINLVFHVLHVTQLALGDPVTGELKPLN